MLIGSIDISGWGVRPDIHQIGLRVTGPAIRDVEITFLDRWNSEYVDPPVNIVYPLENFTYFNTGPHSIQVLRTYGVKSYSPSGEYSIWASFLNAIQTAQNYIYIENEDLLSFDWPPCCERDPGVAASPARDTDLIYQLGEAIKRGVKVAALTNYRVTSNTIKDWGDMKVANYQKGRSIEYLQNVASTATSQGAFTVGKLKVRGQPVHDFVHTKLMLVDDEFSLIGSANFNQRSMTHDNEIMLGIVDSDNRFTKDLRVSLWQEHLKETNAGLDDWSAGFDRLTSAITNSSGNLAPIQLTAENETFYHETKLKYLIDPYAGPEGPGKIREIPSDPVSLSAQ